MSVKDLFKKRYQVRKYDPDKIPDKKLIEELINDTFDVVASKQSLVPYKIHVLGPEQTYYKNKLYELSSGLGGGKQNFNILAPYVLLFTFRHITNPSPSVVKKIARGDKYPSCDIEKYKSQKSQVGIEIVMFSKILTALCLEKDLHVSYLLCFPTFRPEKEGWQKINFLKDPLLFSMQIGHKLNNRYKKPIDEYKPEKSDVINWI